MRGARAGVLPGCPPPDVLAVTEGVEGDLLRLDTWEDRYPEVVCGITTAPAGDFGVADRAAGELLDVYDALGRRLGFARIALPLQVHGNEVILLPHNELDDPVSRISLILSGRVDGQVVGGRGTLLVSVAADCVPVFVLHPGTRVAGLAHAGWRGVAAGILERTLRTVGADPGEVSVHLGPAICGPCYEVDAPVLGALGLGGDRACVDLRGLLVGQALALGVSRDRLSVSTHCTRCGEADLHSHRGSGGKAGRMAAFLGLRSGGAGL